VLGIVRVGVGLVTIISNPLYLLPCSTPGTNLLVSSPSPSHDTRDDERSEQHAASRSQGDNRNEQILLLSLEILERSRIRGGGVIPVRNRTLDIRSLDTLGWEKLRPISIDLAFGIVTLRANPVDEEVGDNVLSAGRLLCEAQVTVTVLLDERGAFIQPASDERGVSEGSGGVGLVSDNDDGVLQRAVPWTGEPFDGTSGPSVAIVGRLRELAAD
jgi:hypothetical protein